MVLAIDAGNTNIVIGVADKNKIYFEGRLSTKNNITVEELAFSIKNMLELYKIDVEKIEGAILATVVPQLSTVIQQAIEMVTSHTPLLVGPGIKTGLNIKTDNPAELGADMVVGAVAAIARYELPQIVIDLGTATTVSVIDKNAVFLGCVIMPGVKTALAALSATAAQLPNTDISAPEKIIATNTIDSMKSGAVFGTASSIDGIVDKIESSLGEKATVIATGGLAKSIIPHCTHDIIYDPKLLIDGLIMIYYKNCK